MEKLALLILLVPLVAAGIITLFTRRNPTGSALISIFACAGSFLLSLVLYAQLGQAEAIETEGIKWLAVGALNVELGFIVDHLSVLMLLIVTGVGLMIHIYSSAYMKGDPGY